MWKIISIILILTIFSIQVFPSKLEYKDKFVSAIILLEEEKGDIFQQIQRTLRELEIYKKRIRKGEFQSSISIFPLRRNLSHLHSMFQEYREIERVEYNLFLGYVTWAEDNWNNLSKDEKKEIEKETELLFNLLFSF